MIVTFTFILALIVVIVKADKQFGKITNSKINFTHVGLMVFTILITSLSLSTLFEFILNYQGAMGKVYIQHGFFSPVMNTWLILITNILNIIALFTVFKLAMRAEKARRFFVGIIPLLFVVGSIKTLNDLYVRGTTQSSIESAMALTLILIFALYAPLFLFYKNKNVKNEIFEVSI